MDYPVLPQNTSQKTWIDRLYAVFEILFVSGLFSSILAAVLLAPFGGTGLLLNAKSTAIFLLTESLFTFLLLALLLRARRETLANLGLQWELWKPNVIAGLILVPLLFLINVIVAYIFQTYFPKYYLERNPLTEIIRTPQQLALFIFSALVAGGIKEELQRAFILDRFRRYLGGAGVGLILWSIAFGAGHYVQSIQGMVVAGIYGFIFGLIYLVSGNLIAPVVAHGAYDTLALLGYWFTKGN
jgi:membrane protease YdiL (CAAX protease family)